MYSQSPIFCSVCNFFSVSFPSLVGTFRAHLWHSHWGWNLCVCCFTYILWFLVLLVDHPAETAVATLPWLAFGRVNPVPESDGPPTQQMQITESCGIFLWLSQVGKRRIICYPAYRGPTLILFRNLIPEVLSEITKNESKESFTADLKIRDNLGMSLLKLYLSIFMCAEYYVYMYCYLLNNLCVVKYDTSFFKDKVRIWWS